MADNRSKIEEEHTLAKIIAEKGVLSIEDAAKVTLQLVKDVSKLHAEGKVHRQISADAVRLDKAMSPTLDPIEPEVTLGGIGIDLVPSPSQLHNVPPLSLPAEIKAAQQVLTEAGILLDPCQIDFYQLGALLCFMVSGHSVSDYLRSCKAKADVPQEIGPIIDRALGMNAKEQFESTEAFISELEAVISGKPVAEDRSGLPDSIFIEPSSKPETEGQLPFKKLGHYEIIERIGHGGMGDVYKGYEKALDRFVAIKVLPAELARQKDFVKRFHAEATAIAKIDHPNIVRIYYSGQDQGHQYFAMQYVDGESLADLLAARKKLTATEALPIIEQCLAGIGAAHKRGLIHRDIKPGNVLFDQRSRRALVTDFGVVKSTHAGTQITVTGTIMGTADYIAPEQARGQDIDCRVDLYAMGILMYQMLSGQLPFEAKSATSMMFQHAYEPPPPLSEVAPDVPEKLAAVVMKLIAKKPEDRYQSTDEVLSDLHYIRLRPQVTTSTSQTSIIEAPKFYSTPELPRNLSKLTGKNWFGRLRNWIVDFFGTHAPQVIEYMQTTSQQVDGAVAEYQRQRDKLADLAKEAKANAAEFESQAKASRRAAQVAGERAETLKTTKAKQRALKEKQENKQTAAELAQLAAEQHQQAEEIDLKLAKLNAKLAQLRSQRDALNARMNAAKARLKTEGVTSALWFSKSKLVYAVSAILLFSLSAALVYMLTRGTGKSPVDKWQTVDFVREIEYFKPGEKQWRGNFYLKGLTFYESGKTSGPWTWEKGWLFHPGDKTKARYVIKQIDGSSYLFMEWMSGDVIYRGQKPSYYVMRKVSATLSQAPIVGLPVVFADNLVVDGIVIRESHCTVDFVQSLLGAPKRKDGNMLRYTDNSLDFYFSGNGLISEIHLNRGFKGRLDTGISLNSTKQEIFNIYGEPVETITTANLHRRKDERVLYKNGDISRIYYGKCGLIFWFNGENVNQIVVFKGRMKSSATSETYYQSQADAGPAVPVLFTLSDEALMSLDVHGSSTARVIDKTDTPGPGVEFDIYFPPGGYSLSYHSSSSAGKGALTHIDLNKYIGYALRFTLMDVKSNSSFFVSKVKLGLGANIGSPGRYRPTFINLAECGKTAASSTGFEAAKMEGLDYLGFTAYLFPKEIENTDGLTITIKIEAVPGVEVLNPSTSTLDIEKLFHEAIKAVWWDDEVIKPIYRGKIQVVEKEIYPLGFRVTGLSFTPEGRLAAASGYGTTPDMLIGYLDDGVITEPVVDIQYRESKENRDMFEQQGYFWFFAGPLAFDKSGACYFNLGSCSPNGIYKVKSTKPVEIEKLYKINSGKSLQIPFFDPEHFYITNYRGICRYPLIPPTLYKTKPWFEIRGGNIKTILDSLVLSPTEVIVNLMFNDETVKTLYFNKETSSVTTISAGDVRSMAMSWDGQKLIGYKPSTRSLIQFSLP